jgi:bidirectional [NiFe] hydrogenase diaphorase subunit
MTTVGPAPSSGEIKPSDKKPGRAPATAPKPGGEPTDCSHPSGDNRFKMLDASMKRRRFAPDSLIEVLHTAQELFGFLQNDLLHYIAHGLKLPPSRVYGVATFYHFFSFTPKGRHTCVVCTGTACYVKGAEALLEAIERQVGTTAGTTTADGRVSLMTARCLGACGLAPVVVFDGEVAGNQVPESALKRMEGWNSNGSR